MFSKLFTYFCYINQKLPTRNGKEAKKNIKFDGITDKRKSRLGAFLYGYKRKKFEDLMPYLKQLLSRIESYHLDIHSSISEIIKIIKPVTVDPDLSGFIIEKKIELLHFFFKLNEFLVKKI